MNTLSGVVTAVTMIYLSHTYFNIAVADYLNRLLGRSGVFSVLASDLPDLLTPIVLAVAAASWGGYFYFKRKGIRGPLVELFLLTGWSVPVTFLLKTVLKYTFGMINTKVWLTLRSSYGFHWFDGGGDYSGFPSGHMAVFTALVLPVVRCFPRLKFVCLVLLLLLGVALIVTGYHFLSDVIAGALLGYLVDRGSWRLLPKDAEERHEEAAPGVLEEVPHPDSTRRLVL